MSLPVITTTSAPDESNGRSDDDNPNDTLVTEATATLSPNTSSLATSPGPTSPGPTSPGPTSPGPNMSSLPRRHSIYGTGEDRIVLDIGSLYIKAGFSGESRPRHIVPVGAGNLRAHWDPDCGANGVVRKECNEGCRITGNLLELYDLNLGKTDEELGTLYDRLAHFLREIYFRYLLTDPKQRKVVLCESPMLPIKLKKMIAKVLFENLQVSSISFAPSHMLALLTTGSTTGLVVDCGHLETVVMPTFSARPLTPFIRTTPLAGRALTRRLETLLRMYGKIVIPPSNERKEIKPEHLTPAVLEDIKTRFLFVGSMHIPADGQIGVVEKTREEDAEAKYANSNVEDLEYPITLNRSGRERQIGVIIVPGWIRAHAADVLFEGDEDESSVVGSLLECLLKCPIHLRQPLASSILLIGGTTLLPSFQGRLVQETLRALTLDKRFESISGLGAHISFLEDNGSGKVFVANCRAWVGGSLIGSLKSTVVEIAREKYGGEVPDWSTGGIPVAE